MYLIICCLSTKLSNFILYLSHTQITGVFMGLLKAAMGSAGGVLADQWLEFFICESLDANVLATKGQKKD
jgi:hypothetical protein